MLPLSFLLFLDFVFSGRRCPKQPATVLFGNHFGCTSSQRRRFLFALPHPSIASAIAVPFRGSLSLLTRTKDLGSELELTLACGVGFNELKVEAGDGAWSMSTEHGVCVTLDSRAGPPHGKHKNLFKRKLFVAFFSPYFATTWHCCICFEVIACLAAIAVVAAAARCIQNYKQIFC